MSVCVCVVVCLFVCVSVCVHCVCVCDPFGEMILAVAVDVSYRPIDPHFALLFTITYLLSTLQRKKNKVSYVHIVR